jgi:MFS family permease
MTGIATFMSAVVLGGALLQWPLGTLSDRIDRRIVMVLAAVIALLAAIAITVIPAPDRIMTILAAAVFGAGAFPLYALAVAHANDNANASDYVEVSSGLLLVYGLGAAAGPLIASMSRQVMEVPTLFVFTAIVHTTLIAWVIWRMWRREAVSAEDRVVFSDAAIAAQTVMQFDPTASEPSAEALQPAQR